MTFGYRKCSLSLDSKFRVFFSSKFVHLLWPRIAYAIERDRRGGQGADQSCCVQLRFQAISLAVRHSVWARPRAASTSLPLACPFWGMFEISPLITQFCPLSCLDDALSLPRLPCLPETTWLIALIAVDRPASSTPCYTVLVSFDLSRAYTILIQSLALPAFFLTEHFILDLA